MQTESIDFKRFMVRNWPPAGPQLPDGKNRVPACLWQGTDYVGWNSVNQLRTIMINARKNPFRGKAQRGRYVPQLSHPEPRWEGRLGQPDLDETETTYVERLNGTLRQHCRRFTRKGYAFSKRWKMLEAALALFFAHYDFCWRHPSLKKTPAMAAGLAG